MSVLVMGIKNLTDAGGLRSFAPGSPKVGRSYEFDDELDPFYQMLIARHSLIYKIR